VPRIPMGYGDSLIEMGHLERASVRYGTDPLIRATGRA
jgi:hypothetical protein